MEQLFLQVVNISISASYLILAIVVARFLLKKAPKKICCVLWSFVGIRLVFPFSIESMFSLVPGQKVIDENSLFASHPDAVIHSGIEAVDRPLNAYFTADAVITTAANNVNRLQVATYIMSVIWIAGMALMLLYLIISWMRLQYSVRMAVPADIMVNGKMTHVYQCDNISSPFLLGLIKPHIFIPYSVTQQDLPYVVLHEKMHIRRGDYLIKPIAFVILTVYWFNPCIWLAYILLCKDIELACDERVIRTIGSDCKKAYSQALLSCSVKRRTIAACPVAFGEIGVKERIKNVLNYKKPAFWMILVALITCITIPVCFMTQKKSETVETEAIAEQTTEQALSEETVVEESETKQNETGGTNDNLAFIEEWAVAFCRRDAVNITNMVTDELAQSLVEGGLLDYGVIDDGKEYGKFGWSSPWPWGPDDNWSEGSLLPNYRIVSLTDHSAEILYYAWVSDPHVTVWREQIDYRIDNGNFAVTSESLQMLDAICVSEEFYHAYPDGIINNTLMDFYRGNDAGEALNQNAKNYRDSQWYAKLFSPDTAAVYLLNILDNKNKVETEVTYSQEKSGVAEVVFHFLEDGSSASVMMLQPYGEDGIWVPQTSKNKTD